MPWMECHLMDERPRFRALEILGCGGLTDRSRRPQRRGTAPGIRSALQAVGQV
jgi:hypothetical protein